MSTTAPALLADLTEGLRRLKLATMRQLAPELLITAKTQRWRPEEFLRTLIEAEIASVRLKATREDRVWLRSPCVLVAYWECPPGPLGAP